MSGGTLASVLGLGDVTLGQPTVDKADAVDAAGQLLVARGAVRPAYIAGMHDREATVSTYLGNGVALPHGSIAVKDEILRTQIVITQYPQGIDWDGSPVHLVVGLAAIGDDHVAVLSALAEVLQDEELCEQLWVTDDAEFLLDQLLNPPADEDDE